MNLNTVPTKGNLMAAKSSLALARQGYELMDKKRNILIREIMDLTEKAELIQHEIDKTFTDAYAALEKANSELGIKAKSHFEKVKDLTIRLSMIENAAYRLAYNIKKTQKRANALQNITIPNYEVLVKTIENALEEKEREEFTRLKVIKSRVH